MPESLGAMQVCEAAAKGDVQTLRLLVECAGIQVSCFICAAAAAQEFSLGFLKEILFII